MAQFKDLLWNIGEILGGDRRLEERFKENEAVLFEDKKAVFFFIPKVASSSLAVFFSDALGFQIYDVKSPHKNNFLKIKKEDVLSKYSNYFKFCFVRNPWDRLVSCYLNRAKFFKENQDRFGKDIYEGLLNYRNLWGGYRFKSDMSFPDFVREIGKIPDELSDPHFRSQHAFITDKKGKMLVDFTGKFENLEKDLEKICSKIGIKDAVLPHLKKSSLRSHYSGYYTEKEIETVRKRYKKDIEAFGYKFENV